MKKSKQAKPLKLSWEEIGFISEGMSFASRPMRNATQSINDEFSLGPRGAWIVRIVSRGDVFPLDLTKLFHIGRSLITAELNRLTDAGLITYKKSEMDGRRVELALTPLGEQVSLRVKQELTKLITQRLSSYTREEVLLCARMLRDFRVAASTSIEMNKSKSSAVKKKSRLRKNKVEK